MVCRQIYSINTIFSLVRSITMLASDFDHIFQKINKILNIQNTVHSFIF